MSLGTSPLASLSSASVKWQATMAPVDWYSLKIRSKASANAAGASASESARAARAAVRERAIGLQRLRTQRADEPERQRGARRGANEQQQGRHHALGAEGGMLGAQPRGPLARHGGHPRG